MRPDGPRDPIVGPDSGPEAPFPVRLDGEVIKGFGRGSKELGIPTANLPVEGLDVGGHSELQSGVYYGWASLSSYISSPSQTASHSLPPTSNPSHNTFLDTNAGDSGAPPHPPDTPQQNPAAALATAAPRVSPEQQLNGVVAEESRNAGVFPMVMSLGYNPYYKNTKRSVEVHIMHSFAKDFYGVRMKIMMLGFIRPEYDYVSVESLVEDIRTDIDVAAKSLARPAYEKIKTEKWLLDL